MRDGPLIHVFPTDIIGIGLGSIGLHGSPPMAAHQHTLELLMSTDWLTRATQPDTDAAPSMDTSEFKSIFRRHPAGVAVVTLSDLGRPIGFTATSVISVSAEPPLLVFSVNSGSSSWPALARAETLAISFLAASQADVSARFATRGIDRFASGGWTRLASRRAGHPERVGLAARRDRATDRGWVELSGRRPRRELSDRGSGAPARLP